MNPNVSASEKTTAPLTTLPPIAPGSRVADPISENEQVITPLEAAGLSTAWLDHGIRELDSALSE